MAGPRYPDYFPDSGKQSVFNSTKYNTYFLYLKAKGLFLLETAKNSENSENQELHRNRYHAKSRSTAGVICQTVIPDLVVSGLVSLILLSSVFRVPALHDYLAGSVCFRPFPVF